MCEENRRALGLVETKSDAIALYKKTIDWALENDYPSLSVLKSDFSDCEADGVYVEKHFSGEILDDQPVYVFHGCTGTIRVGLNVSKCIIPMLYLANGCDMVFKSSGPTSLQTIVPIYSFGDNTICAERSNDILFRVYKK